MLRCRQCSYRADFQAMLQESVLQRASDGLVLASVHGAYIESLNLNMHTSSDASSGQLLR